MITSSSHLTSVSCAVCVGAHFGLHQLTTYIDKKHERTRDKRCDALSDHTKKKKKQPSMFKLSEIPRVWTCWEELFPGEHIWTSKKYDHCRAASTAM